MYLSKLIWVVILVGILSGSDIFGLNFKIKSDSTIETRSDNFMDYLAYARMRKK